MNKTTQKKPTKDKPSTGESTRPKEISTSEKQQILSRLKPLFLTQNHRLEQIEYCMYGVNNAKWLNSNYSKNIPIYFLMMQNSSNIKKLEEKLETRLAGVQETAESAFSDTCSGK